MRLLGALLLCALLSSAQQPTPLWLRGYSVVPTPRQVRLGDSDVQIDPSWVLDAGKIPPQDIAVRSLRRDFREFHGIDFRAGSAGKMIRLAVSANTVKTDAGAEIDGQAYRLRITPTVIEITGNARPGLFYGVQTLIQLAKRDAAGRLLLPEGVIEDWPSFQLRFLHWDAQQHQDRLETLKRYLDWSARFKANMIAFQLEDKFEFPSHPVIGIPGAYTTAQLQELVNYGLERHIQVVPLIQAPAHFSWALKHPEFAGLRSDGNNYQVNLCDPRSYEFIFRLYDDVVNATKGVEYLFASTDEVYYAGIDPRCDKPYNPENRSLRWIEFVQKANAHLKTRGRKTLIWAEYPLLPEHATMLPPDIIDGVIGEPDYIPAYKKLGIRNLRYVSMQGVERFFPDHLGLETESGFAPGRLKAAAATITLGRQAARGVESQDNPIGVFGAAWDASGLHNETFWLGWSTVAQYAWNANGPSVDQQAAEFMRAYYGLRIEGMIEAYRRIERQARAWEDSWDTVPSRVRGPGYGNSYGKGIGTQRHDMTLSPPPLPNLPDLTVEPLFSKKYGKLLAVNPQRMLENDQTALALHSNIGRVDRNAYNLEVYLALANFIGHHWKLLDGLAEAEKSLLEAQASAAGKDPKQAVGHLVASYNVVASVNRDRLRVFGELRTVFERSMYERGRSAGGRKFVDINDDTKDYWAQRRTDLTYMTAPEESIGLEKWQNSLRAVIESYAKQNHVPVRGLAEVRLEE